MPPNGSCPPLSETFVDQHIHSGYIPTNIFTSLEQAVIFLASHDDELGSAGFILNRPTTVQLGDLVEGNALPQFMRSPLYLGGDVGECPRRPVLLWRPFSLVFRVVETLRVLLFSSLNKDKSGERRKGAVFMDYSERRVP